MTARSYSQLVSYKQWCDRSLYEVVGESLGRLDAADVATVLRLLDHIHVVDWIFQHHLKGLPHAFRAPVSAETPDLPTLMSGAKDVGDWYVSYVSALPEEDFEQPIAFVFTSGKPARMTRGEIVLHVCLHGTYHRGNVGILLQKNGIPPRERTLTDFLETAA